MTDQNQLLDIRLSDTNTAGPDQPVRMVATPLGIAVHADGYGDRLHTIGFGSPILLEYRDGVLVLLVWADINQEDPTHVIPLGGAMESQRIESRDI